MVASFSARPCLCRTYTQDPLPARVSGLDRDLGDLLLRVLELDLEDAGNRRRQVEADGAAGRDILADVVAVEVDLVGNVGFDPEADRFAGVVGQLLDASPRLAALDDHYRHPGRGAAHRLFVVAAG